jgi:hypothetical protein
VLTISNTPVVRASSGAYPSAAVATPNVLAMIVAGLMGLQAALGLIFRAQYRDVEWIRETWLGNDWVTLLVAVPALMLASRFAARGSSRAHVVSLGLLAYALYNYAYYLFGAELNAFFPLYVALCVLAMVSVLVTITTIGRRVPPVTAGRGLTRVAGVYFLCVGVGLATVWLIMWADVVFGGHAPPIDLDAFKLVAALDLVVMVPILIACGGLLLWLRHRHGCTLGAAAGLQASMYLTVLSVNSALAVRGGHIDAAGELPVWGTLAVLTGAVALMLLRQIPARGAPAPTAMVIDRAGTSAQEPQRA